MHESVRLGDDYLVTIRGAFDGALAPAVYAELRDALEAGVTGITVDLSQATEVDDGALAVLAATAVDAHGRDGHLFVALDGERVVEIADASLVRAVFDR